MIIGEVLVHTTDY